MIRKILLAVLTVGLVSVACSDDEGDPTVMVIDSATYVLGEQMTAVTYIHNEGGAGEYFIEFWGPSLTGNATVRRYQTEVKQVAAGYSGEMTWTWTAIPDQPNTLSRIDIQSRGADESNFHRTDQYDIEEP